MDVMCGEGRSADVTYSFYNNISDKRLARLRKGGTLVLVDYSEKMLEEAKNKKFESSPRVISHCHDVRTLDWSSFQFKFDIVIGWWNLCYLKTPAQK